MQVPHDIPSCPRLRKPRWTLIRSFPGPQVPTNLPVRPPGHLCTRGTVFFTENSAGMEPTCWLWGWHGKLWSKACQALPLVGVRWLMPEAACPDPDCKAKLESSMARSRSLTWLLKPEALDPRVTSQDESQTRIREPGETRENEKWMRFRCSCSSIRVHGHTRVCEFPLII